MGHGPGFTKVILSIASYKFPTMYVDDMPDELYHVTSN